LTSAEEKAKKLLRLRGHVLAAPARLAIMLLLVARGDLDFTALQKALEMTPGNLWSHLQRLEEHGYIKQRYKFTPLGPRLVIEPTDKGVRETISYLNELREATTIHGKEEQA